MQAVLGLARPLAAQRQQVTQPVEHSQPAARLGQELVLGLLPQLELLPFSQQKLFYLTLS